MATLRLVPSSGLPTQVSTIEVTAAETMVGREPGCDVLLSDGSVSRKHAKIERRGHIWVVVDQGSANGTYVDSQKVGEAVLKNGQELRFGTVAFRVEIPGEDLDVTVAGAPSDATVLASPEAPPVPRPGGPPPIPKAGPPPPPSAAAAHDRFRAAAPGGSPVPQMSAPPPPPRKARSPFFWMASGCCGCLVLVLLFLGALAGGLFFMTAGAAQAAQATLRQIKSGDLDGAYAGLASSYRAQMSREDFETLVNQHPGLKDNMDATFWNRSVTNDRGTLKGVLTPAGGGAPERVTIELRKEDGTWKVSGIEFDDAQEGRSRREPLPDAA